MPKLSTPDLLLLFAYNETSAKENVRAINRIQEDVNVQNSYDLIMRSISYLDDLADDNEVSERALQNIIAEL